MIRLTRVVAKEIKPIMLDADSIESIEPGDILTEITTKRGWVIKVKESPEEVARMVLEYRLCMTQYKVYLDDAVLTDDWTRTSTIRHQLSLLAGLEEQKDATQTSD